MGLLKKAAELNILCNISMTIIFKDLCGKVVCYSSSNMEDQLEDMQNIDIQFSEKNYPDFSTRSFQRKKRYEIQQQMLSRFLPKIDQGDSLKKLKKELDQFLPTYNLDKLDNCALPKPIFDCTDTESLSSFSSNQEISKEIKFVPVENNQSLDQPQSLKRQRPDSYDSFKMEANFSFADLVESSSRFARKIDEIEEIKGNFEENQEFENPGKDDIEMDDEIYPTTKYSLFDAMNYL